MSAINVFCLLVITFELAVALPEEHSAKYENLDVDAILNDEQKLDSFNKCLLSEGPCTPEELNLKENIDKILVTQCGECTAQQKEIVRKSSKFVMNNKPEIWEKMVKHYDPDNKYIAEFIKFINRDD